MLNTKYFIVPLQGGQTVPIQNPYTYGNAWMVDKITYVDNANDEIAAVGKVNLRHEAVADKRFKDVLGEAVAQDEVSVASITAYDANKLAYEVSTGKGGILVLSEIYYPGWKATVDGKPVEVGRVNYILRAINIPAGKHKVELTFFPKSVDNTETAAYIAYAIVIIVILATLARAWWKRRKGE